MKKKILIGGLLLVAVAAPAAAYAAGPTGSDGGAQAAVQRIRQHPSVTGHDVVDGSLGSRDVKDDSLRWSDLSSGVRQKVMATSSGAVTRVAATGLASSASATSFDYAATCPTGTTVIGGGAYALSPGALLQGSFPGSQTDAQASSWTGAVTKDPSAPAALAVTAFAMCQANAS